MKQKWNVVALRRRLSNQICVLQGYLVLPPRYTWRMKEVTRRLEEVCISSVGEKLPTVQDGRVVFPAGEVFISSSRRPKHQGFFLELPKEVPLYINVHTSPTSPGRGDKVSWTTSDGETGAGMMISHETIQEGRDGIKELIF
ncbi:MAG: hypothetical protein ABH833_00505 [Parcubacteria group bacterium]